MCVGFERRGIPQVRLLIRLSQSDTALGRYIVSFGEGPLSPEYRGESTRARSFDSSAEESPLT